MNRLASVGRRTLSACGLLLGVLILNFLLIHAAPGDPATVLAGEMGGASADMLAAIRSSYGLDQPLATQLFSYLARTLRGDLGQSFFYNAPVLNLILARLWPTVLLMVSALTLAVVGGVLLGMVSAYRPNHPLSHAITVLSLVGYALPVFWSGLLLIILFAKIFPLFPVSGMNDVTLEGNGIGRILDTLHHLVLPAVTLASIYIALYSRLTRTALLEALSADYIQTARAKGLPERIVIGRHAFRNAILPIVTLVGVQFGSLLSGAILVEAVFNWPGLGTLAFESVLRRDFPTVLGILLFSSLFIILVNLLTDLAYQRLDPRIQIGER